MLTQTPSILYGQSVVVFGGVEGDENSKILRNKGELVDKSRTQKEKNAIKSGTGGIMAQENSFLPFFFRRPPRLCM